MSSEAVWGFAEEQAVCQLLKAKRAPPFGVVMVCPPSQRQSSRGVSSSSTEPRSAFPAAPPRPPQPDRSRLEQTVEGGAFPQPANEGELCKAAVGKRGELSFCSPQSWALCPPDH